VTAAELVSKAGVWERVWGFNEIDGILAPTRSHRIRSLSVRSLTPAPTPHSSSHHLAAHPSPRPAASQVAPQAAPSSPRPSIPCGTSAVAASWHTDLVTVHQSNRLATVLPPRCCSILCAGPIRFICRAASRRADEQFCGDRRLGRVSL
jgi:hypothetical protein